MISVSVYQKGDIYKLQDMKKMFLAQENINESTEELAAHPNVHTRTITDESGVIAIIGGSFLWAGNMEIWSVTGEGIMKYPLAYVKLVRKLLKEFQIVLKINRFQASGVCGNPALDKWFKSIGFKRESIMEKYGPGGKDFYMYARIS